MIKKNLDLILAAAIGFKAVTLIQLALEKRRTRELTKQLFLDKGRAALAIIRAAVFGPVGIAVVGALTAAAATYAMTRSTGGPVNAGQPYMVGERGPELIVPTNSGMVVPNNQLGMGKQVTVNFNINTVDARGFNELLVNSRGVIVNMINNAVNEKGKVAII